MEGKQYKKQMRKWREMKKKKIAVNEKEKKKKKNEG